VLISRVYSFGYHVNRFIFHIDQGSTSILLGSLDHFFGLGVLVCHGVALEVERGFVVLHSLLIDTAILFHVLAIQGLVVGVVASHQSDQQPEYRGEQYHDCILEIVGQCQCR